MATNIPTRVTRLHNKSAVNPGNSAHDLYQVDVKARQPELFAATYLGGDSELLHVRRKKGSGSSKQLEVMIPMADVIEITGTLKAGESIAVRAYGDVLLLRLRHQVRVTKNVEPGFAVFADKESGELTRFNLRASHVQLLITSEDIKNAAGAGKKSPAKAAPKAAAKAPAAKRPVRREA